MCRLGRVPAIGVKLGHDPAYGLTVSKLRSVERLPTDSFRPSLTYGEVARSSCETCSLRYSRPPEWTMIWPGKKRSSNWSTVPK